MALRLLKYVVRQLEHWRRQHPDSKRMPMILPLVLYHGAEGRWTAPQRAEELFDVPEEERELWLAVLPQFGYGLDDLAQQREEALRERAAKYWTACLNSQGQEPPPPRGLRTDCHRRQRFRICSWMLSR
jgi:hypothetical protein